MKPFFQVLLPTGHLYEILTEAVVQSRAAYYYESHADEFPTLDDALADARELFAADTYAIQDWALNNMDTAELMKHARLVRFTPKAIDLSSGEWSFHDAPAMIAQLDAGSVLDMPVEMALAAMAAHRNICQVATLNDDAGKPASAIVLIQGGDRVVTTYVGALTHLTNALTQPQPQPSEIITTH